MAKARVGWGPWFPRRWVCDGGARAFAKWLAQGGKSGLNGGMAAFYDTHAHLDFPDFGPDVGEVMVRAAAAGVTRVVSVGTDLASSARAVALAERFPGVFAAVGWHPGHASEAPGDIRGELRELAKHPKVVAIGETGLDYYRLPSKKTGNVADDEPVVAKQQRLLEQQLEVAAELGLNCIIHQRECFDQVLAVVRPTVGVVRWVFHCFVGGPEEMAQVIGLGGYVSFTGIVSFKTAEAVRRSVVAAPAGRFMLETDCPFLAPVPHRGKRCEPAYVKLIAEQAAALRGSSLDVLAAETCAAAHSFFPKLC